MRSAARSIAWIAVVVAVGFPGHGWAQPAPGEVCVNCYHPQSPRRLTAADWNWTSRTPTVSRRTTNSILYSPRAGVPALVLYACSQHYHCRIENLQNCPDQSASTIPDLTQCPEHPPVGSWVEVHTAYHDGPVPNPLPEDLEGCDKTKPLVVVGYHARVTAGGTALPLPVHFGPPSAEWSGSSTNADPAPPEPPACKLAAFWSFTLGCDFRLSQKQLEEFDHPDRARALQPPDRLSRDLTHIVRTKHP